MIVRLEQDPGTGALIGCAPEMIRYFNKGYYNGSWSLSDRECCDRPERLTRKTIDPPIYARRRRTCCFLSIFPN